MFGSLITLPWRVGARGVGLAWHGFEAVVDHATGLVTGSAGQTPPSEQDFDTGPPGPSGQAAQAAAEAAEAAAIESATAQPADDADADADEVEAEADQPERPAEEAGAPPEPTAAPAEPEPPPAPAEPEAPAAPVEPEPPSILAEVEPGHVSEEPVLVEEVAEPGAEDGAGAQVTVDEPWDGYRLMNAGAVIDRLPGLTPEALAAVELYELTHRKRQTVVEAAQLELKRRT